MSKRFGTIVGTMVGTALTAGALAILPATAASAQETVFSLSRWDTDSGAVSAVSLTCAPPSGHPYAPKACAQLNRADGFIQNIPDAYGACPFVYDPVTVRAAGEWRGKPRVYEETFPNSCVANLETGGHLFNF